MIAEIALAVAATMMLAQSIAALRQVQVLSSMGDALRASLEALEAVRESEGPPISTPEIVEAVIGAISKHHAQQIRSGITPEMMAAGLESLELAVFAQGEGFTRREDKEDDVTTIYTSMVTAETRPSDCP